MYITLNSIPSSLRSQHMCFSTATGIGFYSHKGIIINKVMESNNLLISCKHGKEIFLIERFITGDYGRKVTIICFWVHAGAR
jgi:hypothetical protein